MGNTISEDLEQKDGWWPQVTQTQTGQTENMNPVPSSSTLLLKNVEGNTSLSNMDESTRNITESEYTASENTNTSDSAAVEFNDDGEDDLVLNKKHNEEKMVEFRSELAKKHLARRQAIAERSKEILFLREELAKQKKENEELREILNTKDENNPEIPGTVDTSWQEEIDKLTLENESLKNTVMEQQEQVVKYQEIQQQNHDLRLNIAEVQDELQSVNAQVISFEKEKHEYQTHVSAMKEVVKVSKQLLEIRENQLQELRTKVAEIEANLAEQETSMLATNLRSEYEKQLRNMRALRTLYEQRQAATKAEKDSVTRDLAEVTKKLENEQTKTKELQERIEELENDVSNKYDKVQTLESQLGLVQAESRGFQAEMSVINQLFSQILVGFKNGQLDLDKLVKSLEENHDLLTDIVINEESMEHISALPKTLLDLVNQVQEKHDIEELEELQSSSEMDVDSMQNENAQIEQQATSSQMCSPAEIVHNLPKVWRVLAELLSQQSGQQPVVINDDGIDPCYKSIETPKGPQIVLSVSQTYIRLKDLILEKKSLEKEMTRLKQLNTHLEGRLQDQEKRLETVSTELSKTWHVVGRMQRQHQQLHTHEKILRYELAQKRKLLTELKQELEYCREKWAQARLKNSTTEEQWKKLRTEFASRKTATVIDDLNNSAESGYSDERECSSDEDSSYGTNKKNKVAVSSPVKPSSDTEDNDEISHGSDGDDLLESAFSKACSSDTIQQSQLTIPEVFVLKPDDASASTSDSFNTQIINLEENIAIVNSEDNDTDDLLENAFSKACATDTMHQPQLTLSEVLVLKLDDEGSASTSNCLNTKIVNVEENITILNLETEDKGSDGDDLLDNDFSKACGIETIHQPQLKLSNDLILKADNEASTLDSLSNQIINLEENMTIVNLDTGGNDEISLGSDVDDILESAFSKACATDMMQQPQLKLSEVIVLKSDEEACSSNSDNLNNQIVKLEENITLINFDCDNQIENRVTDNVKECVSIDEMHHSKLQTETDIEVQIVNDNQTQVQTDIIPQEIITDSSQNPILCTENTEIPDLSDTVPSTSQIEPVQRTSEEILSKREERLRRLEEQCKQLVKKVTNTTNRGVAICTRLETLHEQYSNNTTEDTRNTEQNIEENTQQSIEENTPCIVENIPQCTEKNTQERSEEISQLNNEETSQLSNEEITERSNEDNTQSVNNT